MTTYFETSKQAADNKRWLLVDAENQPLGRLASNVASILKGKTNPRYAQHNDDGDFVVVINADKVKLTGNKEADKTYYHHTGYIGGIRDEKASELRARKPEELILRSVKGMIPKNALGRKQMSNLKVYAGSEHPHSAQNPEKIEL